MNEPLLWEDLVLTNKRPLKKLETFLSRIDYRKFRTLKLLCNEISKAGWNTIVERLEATTKLEYLDSVWIDVSQFDTPIARDTTLLPTFVEKLKNLKQLVVAGDFVTDLWHFHPFAQLITICPKLESLHIGNSGTTPLDEFGQPSSDGCFQYLSMQFPIMSLPGLVFDLEEETDEVEETAQRRRHLQEQFSQLKGLSLGNCSAEWVTRYLESELSENLEVLELSGIYTIGPFFQHRAYPNLTRIKLHRINGITSGALPIATIPNIQELDLQYIDVRDFIPTSLYCRDVECNARTIRLAYTMLDDEVAMGIIKNSKNLESLDISGNLLTNKTLDYLAQNRPHIKELNISANDSFTCGPLLKLVQNGYIEERKQSHLVKLEAIDCAKMEPEGVQWLRKHVPVFKHRWHDPQEAKRSKKRVQI